MQLLEMWQKQGYVSDWAEDSISDYLTKHGKMDIYELDFRDMEKLRTEVWEFTWHETVGGTCNLVPQSINNPGGTKYKKYGGIKHAGGISMYRIAASYNVSPQRLFQYIKKYRFV